METPNVIFSVISDSDRFADNGNDVTAGKSNASDQDRRKKICSSLLDAAASTNAWIITGGLNKGVDQLIGNEVKRKRAKDDTNLQTVIGICDWGCLEDKNRLLNVSDDSRGFASDSNPTRFLPNQHHTHFLLVDDGTQKKSGCEWKLRQRVELHLTKRKPNDTEKDPCCPLIYILIGGSINSLRFVQHALDNGIPVLIATETGGAAEAISKELTSDEGAILENLPEISEKLFNRLNELLDAKHTLTDEVKKDILAQIKDLVVSKQTPSDSNNTSPDNDEAETVQQMRDVIGQMLAAKGLPSQNAKQAVDELEPPVLSEMLENIKLVFKQLKATRTHEQKDLLIKFKVTGKEKKCITSCIADALSKVLTDTPSYVYLLVAAWNDEHFFRKLLLENWMNDHHQRVLEILLKEGTNDHHQSVFQKLLKEGTNDHHRSVLKKLLEKGTKVRNKYAEFIIAHNSNSEWLMMDFIRPRDDCKKNKICAILLKKISDEPEDTDSADEAFCEQYGIATERRTRLDFLEYKVLFIWCVEKNMPETAMLFWKRGQDCLAMALIAYDMSKKMKKALKDKEGYEEMNQQKQFFEQHAINLVNACYADDQQNTHDLLVGKVEYLRKRPITPLKIAGKADFSSFISSVPIQDLLNKIWIKDIGNYKKYKYLPMILSEACPLLAPTMLNIRLTSTGNTEQDKKNNCAQRCKCLTQYFQRVGSFMDTPFVKFTYGFMSYIGYLLLFSVVLLTTFRSEMSRLEMFLHCWTSVLFIEEVKQAVIQKGEYMNMYNYFDMGALITYATGFTLRMIHVQYYPTICPECLYVARIVLAFSLFIFFVRVLPYLCIHNDIGPKIFMMRRLITDLVGFMLILIVFVTAYGVVSRSIMYPNQPLEIRLLRDVYYDASWGILQQFNREELSGFLCSNGDHNASLYKGYCRNTTNDNVDYRMCKANKCPANTWLVSALLALYSLFTAVMLLNVLIAMFNNTFTKISEKEKGVSKMQRYRLIIEYRSQSMIPIPLCVVAYPYVFIKYLLSISRERRESHQSQAKLRDTEEPLIDSDERNRQSKVKEWERAVVAKYYKETKYKKGRNRTNK